MKAVYPVLFTQTEDTVLIEVPDLEILTEGKDLFEAINYAKDSIELVIVTLEVDHESVAAASDFDAIDVNEGAFAKYGRTIKSLVAVDSDSYRKTMEMGN